MSTFGKNIIINLFGESHQEEIGIVINNLPAGLLIDFDLIDKELLKRRPKSEISTNRVESDQYKVISGLFNNKTTGAPLTFIIKNKDIISKDYNPDLLRPSHSDYTAYMKYNAFNDYRGSGHFSGRLTAPLVILGAISRQILLSKNIKVASHILSIKDRYEESFLDIDISYDLLDKLLSSDFPVLDNKKENEFKNVILEVKNKQDSVGGVIETCILGLDPGYGEPFFDSVESIISHLIFSIPGIKGISFGSGFDISKMEGSKANDSFTIKDNKVVTTSNNSGGILGGITNGMPVVFKTAVKPTSSIGKKQDTVNIKTMTNETISLKGRHDPAIIHRVIHVVNALTNYAVLELVIRNEGYKWIK